MFYDVLEADSRGHAKTLAVILHGLGRGSEGMADVKAVVRKTASDGVDLYAPTLPYSRGLDWRGANTIVRQIVSDLDDICASRNYERVVFIGHSMGGALLRRVFLTGAPHSPDYSGPYEARDDLSDAARKDPERHARWASKVDRLVLLASWDKGWTVSERGGWRYNFGLNLLGFIGRVQTLFGDARVLGRTMLDLRRGSTFIVQTRLLWLAYRRWHIRRFREHYRELDGIDERLVYADPPDGAINPLIVQVLGTQDNFVSPQDQVDCDVDGADWAPPGEQDPRPQLYCLMEIPGTNHRDIIEFGSREGGDRTDVHKAREEVFTAALTVEPSALGSPDEPACVRNPSFFADQRMPIDESIEHVAFVIHGIRDDGYWTPRIAKAIKEAAEETTTAPDATAARLPLDKLITLTPTYGYFSMGSFIMPWVRQQKVEWFMDHYVNVKARYPKATMHYVGHSNGTYLAAKALQDYKAARFGRIYFAGSVVHPAFDWKTPVAERRLRNFHNARGGTDGVVALLPKSLEYFSDLGGGGFDGFEQIETDSAELTQSKRYARNGHGGAIAEDHWGEIAQFIVTGAKPFATIGESSTLFGDARDARLAWFSRWRIGIPAGFSLVALVVLLAVSFWVPLQSWNWGSIGPFGGWGYVIWLAALALFLALQYRSPQAPRGWYARALTALLVVLAIGVTDFVVTSLVGQFRSLPTVGAAIGATATLVALGALTRFVLKRF